MQSDDNSLPEISKHAESRKLHLQQQNQQTNTVNSQTSPKPANSAIKCGIADNTSVEKNKIAEATTTGKKKVHRHRFRRKKRQKNRGSSLEGQTTELAPPAELTAVPRAVSGRTTLPITDLNIKD